jgi:hypothetical protein
LLTSSVVMNRAARQGYQATLIAPAIIASLLAACGGGGGSAPAITPPTPPPSAPSPPPETIPVTLDSKNFALAAQLTVSVAEAVLQLGMLATDAADQVWASPHSSGSVPCLNGGTLDLAFTDSNADGLLNNGDTIRASFHQCYQSSVNDVVNGDLTVTLAAAAVTASLDGEPSYALDLQFVSPFTLGAGESQSTVSGDITVSLVRDSLTTTLGVASGASDNLNISVVVNGTTYTEAPRSLKLNKKLDYSAATVELRLAMVYQSQALGGQMTLTTQDYLGGYFNTYPTIGFFNVAGAAPNVARLRAGGQFVIPGNDQSTVDLSSDSFQTLISSQISPWASFTEGFLWWEPLSYPSVFPNGYAPLSLNVVTPQPALLFTRPVNQGTRPINLPIYLQYNVPIASVPAQFVMLSPVTPAGPNIPVSLSFQGARLVVTPQQPLQPGTIYDLSMDAVGPTIVSLQFTAQ